MLDNVHETRNHGRDLIDPYEVFVPAARGRVHRGRIVLLVSVAVFVYVALHALLRVS